VKASYPPDLGGVSLLGAVMGKTAPGRERLFAQNDRNLVATWDHRLKIVGTPEEGGMRFTLYDRSSDPAETHDVPKARPDDEAALRRTVRRQIESSIDVLVPCGTTGEAVTMTPKEQLRVIEITVEEAGGGVPVLAGTGTNDTRVSIEKSKAAAAAGAVGVLC